MRPDARRPRGFVLPTSILVMTLLTVMLASAFILVSAEWRTTDNAFAGSRSLAIAQAGLQNYFSVGHNLLALSKDSTTFAFGNGYAVVVAQKLRDSVTTTTPVTPALWVVRAIGFDTLRAQRGQPNGQRTIAQFAVLNPGYLPARAALTSANVTTVVANGANPIDGNNFGFTLAGCAIPPLSDTTGLSTRAGGYLSSGPGAAPSGGVEYIATDNAVIDSTRIDWAKLVNGEFTPDYVNTLPPANNNTYFSYYYTGDVVIPTGQRRGMLVARGSVTLSGGTHWDGVIVAGDNLDGGANVSYTVHGMIITGLNIALGEVVQPNNIRRGTSRVIRWDWCYAHASIASLMYLVPVKNAWVDTWSAY